MTDVLSVTEAASVLGLSPARVRALVGGGLLPGTKVGGRWVVERSAVEARKRRSDPGGRPFSSHNAWAVLVLASGEDVEGIDSSVRSRLRRALALEPLEKLGPRLSRRAETRFFDAHPGEISYIFEDPELVGTGISAAAEHGLGLVSGQEVDGYLQAGALDRFAAAHALSPVDSMGNVRLRLVPKASWRFLAHRSAAPRAAVALDLTEDPDPRSARAGRAALRDLDRRNRRRRIGRRPARP
jgi:excisionase family DNA binding protein